MGIGLIEMLMLVYVIWHRDGMVYGYMGIGLIGSTNTGLIYLILV
jgi:hypothetical protein